MKMMGGFALSFGIGGLLTGCSSGEGDQAVSSSPDGETSKVLRVAMMGSATDTLDPATFSTLLPLAIALNVYDSLILLRNGVVENSLAESIESNEDATAWNVTLKEGVRYHNGTPVTAEDALYSLQYAGTSPMYSSFYANVDWEGSSVVDERTFTLQLLSPQATFLGRGRFRRHLRVPGGQRWRRFLWRHRQRPLQACLLLSRHRSRA